MRHTNTNIWRDHRGQTTSEYILIVVLVVIAVVVALHFFGGTVKSKFFDAGDKVRRDHTSSSSSSSSSHGSSSTYTSSSSSSPSSPSSSSESHSRSSSSSRHSSSSSSGSREGDYEGVDGDPLYKSEYFGDEEALAQYESAKQKAWLKTILVFAVAGAVLLMLIFMTIERIRLIKKQIRAQQEMDDFRRYPRRNKPVTFKKRIKPKK